MPDKERLAGVSSRHFSTCRILWNEDAVSYERTFVSGWTDELLATVSVPPGRLFPCILTCTSHFRPMCRCLSPVVLSAVTRRVEGPHLRSLLSGRKATCSGWSVVPPPIQCNLNILSLFRIIVFVPPVRRRQSD